MKRVERISCKVHILVCANERPPGGLPSCGGGGGAVFETLKAETLRRGWARTVWVTQTKCLGFCHRQGATLAIYRPGASAEPEFLQGVTKQDVARLLAYVGQLQLSS